MYEQGYSHTKSFGGFPDFYVGQITPSRNREKRNRRDLSGEISKKYFRRMDGSLCLWTDRSEYKIGDELTIFFEVMKSMYVRLVV